MKDTDPVKIDNKPLPIGHVPIYLCVLKDNRISWRARFLHCYMRSFGNDYHHFGIKIAKDLGWDRKTVGAALRELEAATLLERAECHGEGGIFMGYVYLVYPVRRTLYRRLLDESRKSG